MLDFSANSKYNAYIQSRNNEESHMYKLLQNQALRNNHNEINQLGWDEAIRTIPGVDTHMRVTAHGARKFFTDDVQHYAHVADIDADTLDDAFYFHNQGSESEITRYAPQHSLSIGDILVNDYGDLWLCEHDGWSQVTWGDSHSEQLANWSNCMLGNKHGEVS